MIHHTISRLIAQVFLFVFVLFAAFYLSTSIASAQMPATPATLEGWAWSSTIGWISMNCENTNSCGTSNYSVDIDASGNFSGEAWSSTIGWIKFGGLSGFPNATGNVRQNARLVDQGTYAEVTGWARACSGTVHESEAGTPPAYQLTGNCSTMNSRTDGWDGWISFKGTAVNGTPYRVRFNNTTVNPTNRFAWGSNVVGWIDFSGVIAVEVPAIVSFTATPNQVEVNTPTTLQWDIQGFDSCTASNNRGRSDWTGSVNSATGVHTASVVPVYGATVYSLSCLSDGVPTTQTVTVTGTAEIASFTATPNQVQVGDSTTLTWNVSGVDSCTASNNRGQSDWTGVVGSATQQHTRPVSPLFGETVYTLTCSTGGTPLPSQTVTVTGTAEIASFTATPNEVAVGTPTTLRWDVQGVDSCTASNNRGQSDWSGAVPAANGVHTDSVNPIYGSTIYRLSCSSGGTALPVQTVTVTGLADIASFTASLDQVQVGTPTTLRWDIRGVDTCTASNNRGQSDWNGAVASANGVHTRPVNPVYGNITYNLLCSTGGTNLPMESIVVEGVSDIRIDAFSLSALPAPNPDSTYDNVRFLASVVGLPVGTTVNYRLYITGATTMTETGTVSRSGANAVFDAAGTPYIEIDNFNFGDHDFRLEVDLDSSGNGPGSIEEDLSATLQNEDVVGNSRTLLDEEFPPIEPTISFSPVNPLIRAGESTQVSWNVTAPYTADCEITGAVPFQSQTISPGVPWAGSINSNSLRSTSVAVLTCTEPTTSTVFTEEIRVEVVPEAEEI